MAQGVIIGVQMAQGVIFLDFIGVQMAREKIISSVPYFVLIFLHRKLPNVKAKMAGFEKLRTY